MKMELSPQNNPYIPQIAETPNLHGPQNENNNFQPMSVSLENTETIMIKYFATRY